MMRLSKPPDGTPKRSTDTVSQKHPEGAPFNRCFMWSSVISCVTLSLATACQTRAPQPIRAADFPISGYTLLDSKGHSVRLEGPFPPGLPVLVTFMYTTCTTVCPQEAAAFASLQARLGENTGRVRILAISMDPAHDTPQAMAAFLARFHAREGWTFLTGSEGDLRRVRKEFQDRVPGGGPPMPQIFLRSPKDGCWVRFSGSHSSGDLLEICRKEGVL